MRFSFMLMAVSIALLLSSCARDSVEICRTEYGRVLLINGNDTTAAILHIAHSGDTLSDWRLYHSVYHYDYGDVNGDGLPEIAVGVTKKTRYWRTEDKRLFIFKFYDGRLIRPLWLGSRLGCPIETFRIERDSTPARIVSTEHCGDSVVHAMYRIKGFGPKFECYVE